MSEPSAPVRAPVAPERPLVKRAWRAMQLGLAAALTGIGISAALHLPALAGGIYAAGAVATAISGLTFMVSRLRRPRFASAVGAVASHEGLRLEGRELVPRSDMLEAIVTPRRAASQPWLWKVLGLAPDTDYFDVEIRLRGRFAWPVRFATQSLEQARAIVDALGLGVEDRAVTRKVMSPFVHPRRTFPLIFGGMGLAFLGGMLAAAFDQPIFAALVAGLPLGIVTVYTLGLIKTKVTIAADGVSVRWLGKPTTVPLTDIERIEVIAAGFATAAKVRLLRKSGAPFDIEVGLRGNNPFEPFILTDEVALIAERIREAMALREKAEPVEFRVWAAHKQSLPLAEWVKLLRGAVDAYRDEGTLPFSRADLWAIVENARAHPSERAAAAVAVGTNANDETKARLRDVAASTALPRFRVVCEAAADGDEEKLLGALDELRHEAPPADVAPPAMRVELPAEDEAPDAATEPARRAASDGS